MKIVFACQSNSCRSQMAEGWANEWMRRQLLLNSSSSSSLSSSDSHRLKRLQATRLASVALDEDAVQLVVAPQECHDAAAMTTTHHTMTRKQIKAKAVEAMAKLDVDISHHYPKTMQEALSLLLEEEKEDEAVAQQEKQTASRDNHQHKPIDNLIVLCSCGDAARNKLERLSKEVQVWNVEAPSKAADGDRAYARVSLEIRDRIYRLMNAVVFCDGDAAAAAAVACSPTGNSSCCRCEAAEADSDEEISSKTTGTALCGQDADESNE